MKIKYSPDSIDRLKEIKKSFGTRLYKNIRDSIRELGATPEKGMRVENYIDIPNPYRAIHIAKYYIFYRIDNNADVIYITQIFNEREDFLRVMFGISLRTKESVDYWGE